MNGFRCVRSGGLPAASAARSLVLRSPQPSACCFTLKPGNFFSNSAMLVSWMVLTVCGSTSVCQTWSSRVCWPRTAGARPNTAAAAAPVALPARNRLREIVDDFFGFAMARPSAPASVRAAARRVRIILRRVFVAGSIGAASRGVNTTRRRCSEGTRQLRLAPLVDAVEAQGSQAPQHGERNDGAADDGNVTGEEEDAEGQHEEYHADPASPRVPSHESLRAHVPHIEGREAEAQKEGDGVDDEDDEPEGNAEDGDHAQDGEHGNGGDEEESQAEALEGVRADGARGEHGEAREDQEKPHRDHGQPGQEEGAGDRDEGGARAPDAA